METQSQDPLDYITPAHLDSLWLYIGGQSHRKKEAKALFREALYLSGTEHPVRGTQRKRVLDFLNSFELRKPAQKEHEITLDDPAFN